SVEEDELEKPSFLRRLKRRREQSSDTEGKDENNRGDSA
ncbi:MAG: hypothetical protein JWL85_251, partial [Candidatus Saccharibacteria bacterium]|nr:hypothetical protein [Candidatus Saccharibacteria bacterium]